VGGSPGPPALEVGRIVKPHGLRGEVIVAMVSNRAEVRLAPGSRLQGGDRTFEVVRASPHQGRFIVAFAGVGDRDAAEAVRGTVLSAPPLAEAEAGTLWVHELVGLEVRDVAGRLHGTVRAVEANPASDLLVLGDGRLVPLTFVVELRRGSTVVVDPPAGLLDDG